jgi:capsule polysaccharide export protein KpsE/RkpR
MDEILQALAQLREDVIGNESRPSAEAICARIRAIEAQLVVHEARRTQRPGDSDDISAKVGKWTEEYIETGVDPDLTPPPSAKQRGRPAKAAAKKR